MHKYVPILEPLNLLLWHVISLFYHSFIHHLLTYRKPFDLLRGEKFYSFDAPAPSDPLTRSIIIHFHSFIIDSWFIPVPGIVQATRRWRTLLPWRSSFCHNISTYSIHHHSLSFIHHRFMIYSRTWNRSICCEARNSTPLAHQLFAVSNFSCNWWLFLRRAFCRCHKAEYSSQRSWSSLEWRRLGKKRCLVNG